MHETPEEVLQIQTGRRDKGADRGRGSMVGKPKYGILGTDESHLAFVKGWKKRGNQGRTGGYPNFIYACMYVCMYIHVRCMLALQL